MANLNDWDMLLNGAFGRSKRSTSADNASEEASDATARDASNTASNKVFDILADISANKSASDRTITASAVDGHNAAPQEASQATPTAQPLDDPFSALNAALLEQQKSIDAQLKAQQDFLQRKDPLPDLFSTVQGDDMPTSNKNNATAAHPSAQAEELFAALEADGLLATGTSATTAQQQGSFAGLAEELKETVHGQDVFVDGLVRAMRRPFLLGTKAPAARNVVLISGGEGTGRHFALTQLIPKMAARGLLKNATIATINLALYPDSSNEKIFLQDLYAALHTTGEVVVFERHAQCHPSFLKTLAALATTGSAPLSSRYILNKDGILVDAGNALAPGAIRALDPCSKYLLFYAAKGKSSIADHFGAGMLSAIGDCCATVPFTPKALQTIAATHLQALQNKISTRLGFTLAAGEDVRDLIAASAQEKTGAEGILTCCDKILRALSEYCLGQDTLPTGEVTICVKDGALTFTVGDAEPADLFALLPTEYQGSRTATEAALDALVGLDSVKNYVRALADNLEIQKRRTAAGFKNASLSMHMIFSGNPGTGKTTIARLIAQYLKAIGALRGGQLIEVTRADLVGRYSGHTAPLTNNVIESALGGVLFIDEAYSLFRGEQDSFGLEAIDTLVKGMEDHRDDLVVVLAGYTNEMNVFLTANSGLASRFSNNIEFPDYSGEELLAITKLQAKGKGYRMAEECDLALLGYYNAEQALHADTAGNGRMARNTLEKAILNQSKRLIALPDAPLDLLERGDFELETDLGFMQEAPVPTL